MSSENVDDVLPEEYDGQEEDYDENEEDTFEEQDDDANYVEDDEYHEQEEEYDDGEYPINEDELPENYDASEDIPVQPKSKPVSYIGLWFAVSFIFAGIAMQYINYSNQVVEYKCRDSPARPAVKSRAPSPISSLSEYIDLLKFDLTKFTKPSSSFSSSILSALSSSKSPSASRTLVKLPEVVLNTSKDINSYDVTGKETAKFIAEVVLTKEPVKIINSIAKTWKALKWNLWEISKEIGSLDEVLSSISDRVFLTSRGLETDIYIYPHLRPARGFSNLLFADFLYGVKESEYLYFYSGNYRLFEQVGQLEKDTTWQSFRYSESIIQSTNLTLNNTDSYLSLMYPNTALQARYSEYHTFRIQLQGFGKYYLIDPDYSKYLYVFPSVHSSAYQAQVDLYNPERLEKFFPRSKKVVVQQVRLKPGEILYIPPYHYVHSEAQSTLGAYLDVLSPSLEQLILSEAGYVQAKFANITAPEEKIIISQVYLVHILSRVQGIVSPKKFATALYNNRYSTLYPENSAYLQKVEQDFDCYAKQPEISLALLAKVSKGHITKLAELVSDAVNDPAVRPSVRWLWLSNYVENVALWAMNQDPDRVVLFIRQCLNFESKLHIQVEVEGPPVIKIN